MENNAELIAQCEVKAKQWLSPSFDEETRQSVKQMLDKADAPAENAASRFLDEIGLIYLAWPQAQTKPDGDTNRAVLNASNVKIIKIEQVQVNEKNKFIQGSQKEIEL